MKLAVLACFLVVAAFAAPTSTFAENDGLVPEELVQMSSSDSVSELKAQFHELQVQLQGGMERTQGVKATIDKMIEMITSDIEPAINDAHVADQSTLDTKMQVIASLDSGITTDVSLLNGEANTVRTMIGAQQAAAAAWDTSASAFTTTETNYVAVFQDKSNVCCAKKNAAVIDVEYVPSSKDCDYTVHQKCAEEARSAVADIVSTPFTDGLKLYRSLLGRCTQLTLDLAKADKATDADILVCQTNKRDEKAKRTIAADEQTRVQSEWDTTVQTYHNMYTVQFTGYTTTKADVTSQEVDRKAEWQAVQEIKCLLKAYKDGGGINSGTELSCKQAIVVKLAIGYPVEIAEQSPVLAPFEALTTTDKYENTCDARKPEELITCVVKTQRAYPVCESYSLVQ